MKWKPAKDFEGLYEVSDTGLVRNLRTGKCIGFTDRVGYRRVTLFREAKLYTRYVHVMVMQAFVGPCPKGQEVRHWDGDKGNARLDNLLYGTRQDNWDDRKRLGEMPKAYRRKATPIPKGWQRAMLQRS